MYGGGGAHRRTGNCTWETLLVRMDGDACFRGELMVPFQSERNSCRGRVVSSNFRNATGVRWFACCCCWRRGTSASEELTSTQLDSQSVRFLCGMDGRYTWRQAEGRCLLKWISVRDGFEKMEWNFNDGSRSGFLDGTHTGIIANDVGDGTAAQLVPRNKP